MFFLHTTAFHRFTLILFSFEEVLLVCLAAVQPSDQSDRLLLLFPASYQYVLPEHPVKYIGRTFQRTLLIQGLRRPHSILAIVFWLTFNFSTSCSCDKFISCRSCWIRFPRSLSSMCSSFQSIYHFVIVKNV